MNPMDMPWMVKVADWLDLGYKTTEQIRADLLKAGLSEGDAYLTFKAGVLIYNSRQSARPTGSQA